MEKTSAIRDAFRSRDGLSDAQRDQVAGVTKVLSDAACFVAQVLPKGAAREQVLERILSAKLLAVQTVTHPEISSGELGFFGE